MFYYNLKSNLKKFPIFWNFLTRFKDYLMRISRVKDVVIMMVLFNIWPEQIYRFSTRKLLPAKKNRFSKKIKPIIPFELLEDKSSNINKIKEIDLIVLGESFNFKNLSSIIDSCGKINLMGNSWFTRIFICYNIYIFN